jgi:DNA-binding beta-propeller fold protein YncE
LKTGPAAGVRSAGLYDAVHDRILITAAATDPVNPNSLLEVSLSSNERRVAVTFPSEPNLVRLSEDGTLLYVTFTGSVEIRRYDAATLQQVSTIQMQSDQPFTAQREIFDLAVSPLDPNVIAVAFGFLLSGGSTDVAIVNGDTQLAGSFHDLAANQSAGMAVEYSRDGARIFGGGGRGRVLDVDAGGIASFTWIRDGFSERHLQRVGDRLYSGETAIDEQTLVRLGMYNASGNAVGIDTASNLVFRVDRDTITVFDEDRFVPLASYDSGLNHGAPIRKAVAAGQFGVLLDEHALHIFAYADIETLNTGVCEVEALATDQGEPYTRYACPVSDAVYDPARDKVYAAIDSFFGVNGNSIAVIDRASGVVERFAYIGSEPRKIALSTDGNRLYAIFDGADTVAALNLSTFTPDWNLPLELLPVPGSEPELEPQRALDFAVSPAENDAIVVSISDRNSDSTDVPRNIADRRRYGAARRRDELYFRVDRDRQDRRPVEQAPPARHPHRAPCSSTQARGETTRVRGGGRSSNAESPVIRPAPDRAASSCQRKSSPESGAVSFRPAMSTTTASVASAASNASTSATARP